MNKSVILKNFSKAAAHYNDYARVQHQVGEALITALPKKLFKNVLELGCGTGVTTLALIRKINYQLITAQDFSENLLAEASKMFTTKTVKFIKADFDVQLGDETSDLIFSNMALHWSSDFTQLLTRLFQCLEKGGVLAFSMPLNKTFHEIEPLVNTQYFLNAETVKIDLTQNNFEILHQSSVQHEVQFASLHEALTSIKKTGANTTSKNKKIKLTRTLLKKSPQTLTYNCGLFIARKPC